MPYTNFPDGATSMGVPLVGGVGGIPLTGNWWFVNETTGSDGNQGTADSPLATLARAQTLATANQNDVVCFEGTIHTAATITWAKNQVHLLGMSAPTQNGKRVRISTTGTTGFSPMVSVTASGCWFSNFETFFGIADNAAIINWSDTGGRNCYDNVEFLGFGSSNTAALTTARAFVLNTNTGETTWRNCYFGTDTVARTAANYTLEIAGAAPRLTMIGCKFAAYLTGSGASASHLLIGSAGIDRWLDIKDCIFAADTLSGGSVAMTQAFNISGSAGGYVLAKDCWFFGATNVETSASSVLYMTMATVKTSDAGLAVVNAP